MDTNVIVKNEKIDEIVKAYPKTNFKSSAVVGVAMFVCGMLTYKHIVKPIFAKIKAKKDADTIEVVEENE